MRKISAILSSINQSPIPVSLEKDLLFSSHPYISVIQWLFIIMVHTGRRHNWSSSAALLASLRYGHSVVSSRGSPLDARIRSIDTRRSGDSESG